MLIFLRLIEHIRRKRVDRFWSRVKRKVLSVMEDISLPIGPGSH